MGWRRWETGREGGAVFSRVRRVGTGALYCAARVLVLVVVVEGENGGNNGAEVGNGANRSSQIFLPCQYSLLLPAPAGILSLSSEMKKLGNRHARAVLVNKLPRPGKDNVCQMGQGDALIPTTTGHLLPTLPYRMDLGLLAPDPCSCCISTSNVDANAHQAGPANLQDGGRAPVHALPWK